VDSLAAASIEEEAADIYFGNAVDVVLKESAKQVSEAQKFLGTFLASKIQSFLSHYIAAILLHRLAAFVEKSANDGLLTKKEANTYLEKIDRNLQAAHIVTRSMMVRT
jgi:hypothetical protein